MFAVKFTPHFTMQGRQPRKTQSLELTQSPSSTRKAGATVKSSDARRHRQSLSLFNKIVAPKSTKKSVDKLEESVGVVFTTVNKQRTKNKHLNDEIDSIGERIRCLITARDIEGLDVCLSENVHLLDYVLFVTPADDRQSILSLVCSLGLLDVVKLLHSHKLLRNITDGDGYSPLHRAAYSQHTELVKYLTNCFGAEALLDCTQSGFNVLHVAANLGHVDMLRFVAQRIDDVNVHSEKGWNALHIAAHAGFTKV